MESKPSVFETLSKIEVKNKVRQKGNFWYVSWSNAVRELLKHYPRATWEFASYDGMPYLKTPAGCFVECAVEVDGVIRKQMMPVLDFKNKSVHEPDSTQINKSQQRALTKAIALHGFGLELWAGEDLDKEEEDAEPAVAQKPFISDDRLRNALDKIATGEYTIERLEASFEITDEQRNMFGIGIARND